MKISEIKSALTHPEEFKRGTLSDTYRACFMGMGLNPEICEKMIASMRKDIKGVNHDGKALNVAAFCFYGSAIALPVSRKFFDSQIAKDILIQG